MEVVSLRVARGKPRFDDLDTIAREIAKHRPKKVLIQAPDGLKWLIPSILSKLRRFTETMISGDPCYGACFLALPEARLCGADLLLHIGHSPLKDLDYGDFVIFVEVLEDPGIAKHFEATQEILRGVERIGVVTNVHHIHLLDEICELVERGGVEAVPGGWGKRAWHRGQIIGCDYSSAKSIEDKIDAYLFVGGGSFHPLGLALATPKPVFSYDPYVRRAFSLEPLRNKVLKQRYAIIEKAKHYTRFGILAGLRLGQHRPALVHRVCKLLEKHKRYFEVWMVDEIKPDKLAIAKLDAFINTACPRVAIDDAALFEKPLLLPKELLISLGDEAWERYVERGLLSETFGYDLHIL